VREYTIEKVKEILSEYSLLSLSQNGTLRLIRDEIVNTILSDTEEDSYKKLLTILKERLNYRFYFALKSDDYLWLDTISGE
jgi:hypothetical protein